MKLIYIIIIIILIFFVISEIDRNSDRKQIPNFDLYYARGVHWMSPYNLFLKLNSKKENIKPILDIEKNFPNHQLLKNNWIQIKDEILSLIDQGKVTDINGDQFFSNRITDDGKWKKYYLKWYSSIKDEDRKNCPFTSSILDQIPEVQLAMFSVLEPGATIKPHLGPFKGSYRYHLGLDTPNDKNCFISVDGERYSWKDGEDVLFDDTFIHFVKNNTDKRRVILFCDVKRKLNNNLSNNINSFVCDKLAPLTTRANEKNEKAEYLKK